MQDEDFNPIPSLMNDENDGWGETANLGALGAADEDSRRLYYGDSWGIVSRSPGSLEG